MVTRGKEHHSFSFEEGRKFLEDALAKAEVALGTGHEIKERPYAYLNCMVSHLMMNLVTCEQGEMGRRIAMSHRIAWRLGYYEAIQDIKNGRLVVKPHEGKSTGED